MRRIRGLLAGTVAVIVAMSVMPSVARAEGPGGGRAGGVVSVGAAALDVSPPLAARRAPNPADCTTPQQRLQLNGPHLFALEEPYTDTNRNGHYDPGEPFLDCRTPLANGGFAPPDGRWDGIYLGGGNCCNRQPTAQLDPLWARTIVVAGRGRTVSLTSVDNEGVFKEIWDQVRTKLAADGARGLDQILFTSTHDESAPDTIGISGPNELTSGSDPFYVQFLVARAAQSIEQAAARLRPATLRFGEVHPDDLVTCWSSYPFGADAEIGAMQARAIPSGRPIVTLLNYGIHAEELGFSTDAQDRLHLSSDWPNFARAALERRYGGLAMTVAGSVGSVEMPQVYPAARSFEPQPVYSSQGNGGCRTIYTTDATRAPYGYHLSTQARGERIASWAERALGRGRDSTSNDVEVARKTFFVPLDNALFALGGALGVLPGKDGYDANRNRIPRDASGRQIGSQTATQFLTDAFWLRVGDGEFVSAPGEVFPYTYARDFGGPHDQPVPDGQSPPAWVMARMTAPWRFVVGLADDMIGYIFPKTNAVGVPTSLAAVSDVDRFGCGHSDDGEAAAKDAGGVVVAQLTSIMPKPRDAILPGRYLYSDGTLHRSPLGDGGQACTGPGHAFVPAPGGAAVGVAVGRRRVRIDGVSLWWMDLRGRPQRAPSTQTRGVIDQLGHRFWLDVFPDLPRA